MLRVRVFAAAVVIGPQHALVLLRALPLLVADALPVEVRGQPLGAGLPRVPLARAQVARQLQRVLHTCRGGVKI